MTLDSAWSRCSHGPGEQLQLIAEEKKEVPRLSSLGSNSIARLLWKFLNSQKARLTPIDNGASFAHFPDTTMHYS
jgi:hypothetical protein